MSRADCEWCGYGYSCTCRSSEPRRFPIEDEEDTYAGECVPCAGTGCSPEGAYCGHCDGTGRLGGGNQ